MWARKLALFLLLLTAICALGLANNGTQLSVWTDKSQYTVGETVNIYYFTNTNCIARVRISKPDGSSTMIVNQWVAPGLYTFSGQAGYPLGQRTVVFDCEVSAGILSTQSQYSVVSGSSGGVPGQNCIQFPWGVVCIGSPTPGQPSPGPAPGGQLPSYPPLPGIDPGDFGQGQGPQPLAIVVMPTISPNGIQTTWLGSGFPVTVSGIDTTSFTAVMLAELQPSGQWFVHNLAGWHPTGQFTANWMANMRGTFYVLAWIDNNHNWSVDFGELTIPWLTVQVP